MLVYTANGVAMYMYSLMITVHDYYITIMYIVSNIVMSWVSCLIVMSY